MLTQLHLSLLEKDIARARETLRGVRGGLGKAASRAINRTLTFTRTRAVKEVRKELVLKAKTVREHMAIQKATKTRLYGAVNVSGKKLSVYQHYQVAPRKHNATLLRRPKVGVRIRIRRDEAARPLPRSFVAHWGWPLHVIERVDDERDHIRRVYGPRVPDVLADNQAAEAVMGDARVMLAQRFDHEVGRLLETGRA